MANPHPKKGKPLHLKGRGRGPIIDNDDLPAIVRDADGRRGRFVRNSVRLDTGETVEPEGFSVVWPGTEAA